MKELIVWCGPMGSAKTTGALHAARRFQRLGKIVKLVRPKISLRSHETLGTLTTKNGESFSSIDLESSVDLASHVREADIVWIDEPFLFSNEEFLFNDIQKLRKTKDILISSLGADCQLNPFKQTVPKLLAVADEIIHCKADCDACGLMGRATRTLICVDSPMLGQVHVGGSESYSAVCPLCWTFLMTQPSENRKQFMNGNIPSRWEV